MTDNEKAREEEKRLLAFAKAAQRRLETLLDRRIDPYSGLTAARFVREVVTDMKRDGTEPPIAVLKRLEALEERHFGEKLVSA